MDEKTYKTIGSTGICVLAGGIAAGILLIINGARLLGSRSNHII